MMSVTISTYQRCSVRLYLQLLVERLVSSLRYLSLFGHSDVQHKLCCVFVLFFFFVYVASFSGLSIFDCSFGII
jgi:hypothetical protein